MYLVALSYMYIPLIYLATRTGLCRYSDRKIEIMYERNMSHHNALNGTGDIGFGKLILEFSEAASIKVLLDVKH